MSNESRTSGGVPRWVAWLVAQGVINSVYCRITVFGSIFILFLHDLGMSKSQTGAALSLIPFSHLIGLAIAPAVARFGPKRAYVLGFGVRNLFVALMLATPWVRAHWGDPGAFAWVCANVLCFALARAFGEMGMYPWYQEVIPNAVRGRIGAVASTLGTGAGLVAAAIAARFVGHGASIGLYLEIMGVGVVLGFIATACLLFIPGGKPSPRQTGDPAHIAGMRGALADRDYARYLQGYALVTLSIGALFTFAPLYMRERIGLTPGAIIFLEVAGAAGGLLAGYPAGRNADRSGARPVMCASVALLTALPVLYAVMPQRPAAGYPAAIAIWLLLGAAYTGWLIAADRYLNVCAIPPARRTPYIAVFYSLAGLSAGVGPLVAGRMVDACAGLSRAGAGSHISAYTPLFAACAVMLLVALRILTGVPDAEADAARSRRRRGTAGLASGSGE